MRKAIAAAIAAVTAIAPTPMLIAFGGLLASGMILVAPPPVAHAECPGPTPTQEKAACYCAKLAGSPYNGYEMCIQGEMQTMQQEMQLPCPDNKRRILDPPWCVGGVTSTPNATPAQAPNNSPKPAQPPVTKPAVVAPPKGLNASPPAIAAAKAAPPTQVDPANPPRPPTVKDFKQRVQDVIKSHNANVDVVNGRAHPRHWDYIDYDQNQHPVLYNPVGEAMSFRYFYAGEYREVYVAAGTSVALNVAVGGVFPFTAVGENYLTSGSFHGGSPPPPYRNVAVHVPAQNQTVQVGQVQPVGHDESQPVGSQDTFMLDDTTLAWGQATNPADGGEITVAKTQTLPGVGPTDEGQSLVDLAVPPRQQTHKWLPWTVGAALLIAVGLIAWAISRRKRARSAGGDTTLGTDFLGTEKGSE